MRPHENIIDSDAVIGRFCLSVRFHREPEMKKIAPLPLRVLVLSVLTAAHFVARPPCVAEEANALPADAITAQADYISQRRNGLILLNERYLAKLNELLVAHTRNGALNPALAIRAEIARIEEENTFLKKEGPPPLGSRPARTGPQGDLVAIEASAERGSPLADATTGDKVILRYVSGKWKNHGVLPSENPDGAAIQRGNENRLAIFGRKVGATRPVHLAIVPTDTENTPFEFIVPPGYKEIFLRLNEDPDNEWKENPGKVVYQVTIQKP